MPSTLPAARRFTAGCAVVAVAAVPIAFAPAAHAAPADDVRINEVIQNHPSIPDSIELTNIGEAPIDLSGWVLADDKDRDPAFVLPAETVIAPGQFLSFEVDVDGDEGFGLGRADEARLIDPSGQQVDRFAWTEHTVTSYGRNPDGTGEFAITAEATPGAANIFSQPGQGTVVINEVESNRGEPGDWVELFNTGDSPVDLTGWVLRDDTDEHAYALPAGSRIEAGGYLVLDEADFGFGLGGEDQARLFLPGGAVLVDETSWTGHAAESWGRCPDGIGEFGQTLAASKGGPNVCAEVEIPPVVINEIESNQGEPGDWVELFNAGDSPVDLGGWIVTDSDPLHVSVIAAGSVIEPGGFFVIEESQLGYGLGKEDAVRVFLADRITLVDEHSWAEHAPTTLARCPDGIGEFRVSTASTKAAANDCSAPLRINEVESSGDPEGDWVELVNVGVEPVDASGMSLRDGGADNDALVLPSPTVIGAGEYLRVFTEPTFGLGAADLVRLLDVDGSTVLDETEWSSHATVTWGRCPDGTGEFGQTREATPGAKNACDGDLLTSPWPGSANVSTADIAGTFGGDMSGVIFEPGSSADDAIVWAVNNGSGTLHRLALDGGQLTEVGGWQGGAKLRYPDGTGTVDAEAVALSAENGVVYVGSERNTGGGDKGSRPSVLRYAIGAEAGELVAQHEWNLSSYYPGIGANAGIEGLAWVPDSELVAGGLTDSSTGEAYDPSVYGEHGGGVFFVGVEATSVVAGYVLQQDGGIARITEFTTAFPGVMELEYEPVTGELWAYCDEVCEGRSQTFSLTGGGFRATAVIERPAGMANIANEGLAFAPEALCVDGEKSVVWADDAATDGHAFRLGAISCGGEQGGGPGDGDGDGGDGGGEPGGGDGGTGGESDDQAAGKPGDPLARTGAEASAALAAIALLLLTGAALVVLRTRISP